jgi:hypothetical protein
VARQNGLRRKTGKALQISWVGLGGVHDANRVAHQTQRSDSMNTPCIEESKAELVVFKGFEGEDIEVSFEQLEPRIVPQSTAGFLD